MEFTLNPDEDLVLREYKIPSNRATGCADHPDTGEMWEITFEHSGRMWIEPDPTNNTLLVEIPGTGSAWRDYKYECLASDSSDLEIDDEQLVEMLNEAAMDLPQNIKAAVRNSDDLKGMPKPNTHGQHPADAVAPRKPQCKSYQGLTFASRTIELPGDEIKVEYPTTQSGEYSALVKEQREEAAEAARSESQAVLTALREWPTCDGEQLTLSPHHVHSGSEYKVEWTLWCMKHGTVNR